MAIITDKDIKSLIEAGASIGEIRKAIEGLTTKEIEKLKKGLDEVSDSFKKATDQQILYYKRLKDSAEEAHKQAAEAATTASSARKKAELQIEAEKAKLELLKAQLKTGEATADKIDEQTKAIENLTKETKEATKATEDFMGGFDDLLSGNIVGGLTKLSKGFIRTSETGKKMGSMVRGLEDKLFDLVKTTGKGSAGAVGAIAGLGIGLAALAIAAKITKMIFDLAMQVMDAENQFRKITGASAEFASSMGTTLNETRKFGASIEETSASMQSLFMGVTDFTMMSEAARVEMSANATMMSKLGVSNEDFARGSQIAIKAMGQTGIQAAATQREIAAAAMDIGVAPSKMASDFANAGPQLAKFGRDGVRAFKDLSVTAKVTGIEVNRLLAITGKFDTFEGAAEQAGKLNAALGGNFVNAMELMTETDPTERFKMMRDSILDAGLSFDEMSYYQRKFFTESMGLQDEAELAALMSGNMDSLSQSLGKTSAEYADMADQAKKVQSFQEKLNTLMMQLIPVVTPLVDVLVSITDWMMENLDEVVLGFKVMLSVVLALAAGLGILAIGFAAATAPVWGTAAAITALVVGIGSLASLLFVDSFASSFLEGLFKIGDGFGFIAEMAAVAAAPIIKLQETMNDLGLDMFKGEGSLKLATEMTGKNLEGVGNASMQAATKVKAAAPVIATSSAVSNAVSNTTINNGVGGGSNVNIKFDNKKFSDLFDIQVEKSIGRAARKAVI